MADKKVNQQRGGILQSILKWVLRTSSSDETEETKTEDKERMEWLRTCLDDISDQPSETNLLKAALVILESNYSTTDSDEANNQLIDAFEQLQYLVEDLNHAGDLIPMKGVDTIIQYINHPNSELQICALDVIAASTQNLPKCQEAFSLCVSQLLTLLKDQDTSDGVRAKALYALSAIVRGYEPTVKEFQRLNGMDDMLYCLKSFAGNRKITTKVCRFIQALYLELDDYLIAQSSNIIKVVMDSLQTAQEDNELSALYCTTLSSIAAVHQPATTELKEKKDQLQPILNKLVTDLHEEDSTRDVIKELIVKLETD